MNFSKKKMERKKEQILASAIEIINKRGYSGATMEEIAAELLMTKGSLYYYFKNKSDLLYQCHNFVLVRATNDLKTILESEETAEVILKKMIDCHLNYAVGERNIYKLIIDPKQYFDEEQLEPAIKLRENYEKLFDQIIARGIENGEFTVREKSLARLFILGGMNWVQQWYNPNGRLPLEELISLYCEYILKLLK